MKYKMTVNKTKLYNLVRDFYPDHWPDLPALRDCYFDRISPYHYNLRAVGLRVTLLFYAGVFTLTFTNIIDRDYYDYRLSSKHLTDRDMVMVVA